MTTETHLELLLNANCYGLRTELEESGYDVAVTTRPDAPDEAVQVEANRAGRILITADRDWHKPEIKKVAEKAVIIVQDAPEKLDLVLHVLQNYKMELLRNESFSVKRTAGGAIQVRPVRKPPPPAPERPPTGHDLEGDERKDRRGDGNTPDR